MEINELVDLDRAPAFPVYPCIYDRHQYDCLKDYTPGRILLGHYENYSGETLIDLTKIVTPGDIVYMPLYGGKPAQWTGGRWIAHNASEHMKAYDNNLAILKDIAPHVRGILVGNAGPEMSFKEFWEETMPRKQMSIWAADFVKETAEMIGEAGGTAFYGTIDWDLAIDCYFGDSVLRHTVNELGAFQICFCGFQLFNLTRTEYDHLVPRVDDPMFWNRCPKQEQPPWAELTEYIKVTKNIWTGLNSIEGLQAGFDIQLKERGFEAGVMGCDIGWPQQVANRGL